MTERQGCWPPEGTAPGTTHWLVWQPEPGLKPVLDRAMWHGGKRDPYWTRWLDERPTGDFAALCHAIYVGSADTAPCPTIPISI